VVDLVCIEVPVFKEGRRSPAANQEEQEMRKDRNMGSIRSSRGGGRRSVSINNNVDIVIFLKIEMSGGREFRSPSMLLHH